MSDSELEALKQENSRLRQIIYLLLGNQPAFTDDSILIEIRKVKSTSEPSLTETGSGHHTTVIFPNGNSEGKDTVVKFPSENLKGKDTVVSNTSGFEKGKEAIVSSPSEDKISPEQVERLSKLIPLRGRKVGRKHTAQVLIHLYGGGSSKSSALCRLTGLTESGVNKLIYRMKKHDIIRRSAWQHFVLIEKALDWIKKSEEHEVG